MELKVFTLPTCPDCPAAKTIVAEVAQKHKISFRVVDMSTKEGMDEGLANNVQSAPSIAIDREVIVRGRLFSAEKLEEEVRKRLMQP